MTSLPLPHSWDIFCHVVDNFGDIGVCWRLARQLAREQGGAVRLWVDDLASLHMLCPQADPDRVRQSVAGVEVHRWGGRLPAVHPAQVVIEAFGCGLPEEYVSAMVAREPRPLWITLEYLSAEPWVRTHHGLPSPHPRWPLERYFFFPGVVAGTGGVLCEADLKTRRARFEESGRNQWWQSLGFEPPADDATVVSMFAYDHASLAGLLAQWEQGAESVVVALPQGRIVQPVIEFLGAGSAAVGRSIRRGKLEVRLLPFLEQLRYDELLWACDCNFVRGEDSFVRAQWAGRPLIWQIYRQQEGAHWRKLQAFLDVYCTGLSATAAAVLRGMWESWNAGLDRAGSVGAAWREFWAQRTALTAHAGTWARQLAEVGDMAGRLAQFCRERLK